MVGGMEASGSLAKGEKKTVAVETEPRGGRLYLPMRRQEQSDIH